MTTGGKIGRFLASFSRSRLRLPVATSSAFYAVAARKRSTSPISLKKVDQSVVRIDVTMEEGQAIGSGYVVDESGIIATNYHVMAGAKDAIAVFKNGQKYPVKGTLMLDGKTRCRDYPDRQGGAHSTRTCRQVAA